MTMVLQGLSSEPHDMLSVPLLWETYTIPGSTTMRKEQRQEHEIHEVREKLLYIHIIQLQLMKLHLRYNGM